MSRFDRAVAPAANAVLARNEGANPRLTSANAPFFTKTLRDVMVSFNLKSAFRNLQFHRRWNSGEPNVRAVICSAVVAFAIVSRVVVEMSLFSTVSTMCFGTPGRPVPD
jgi:hypothetical protein